MLARLAIAVAPLLAIVSTVAGEQRQEVLSDPQDNFECDLPPIARPAGDGLPSSQEIFSSQDALSRQVERHAAIVKIPTISYDDSGEPGEDPRWNVFHELHRAFAYLYPHV